MSTVGWVLVAVAFVLLVALVTNSWMPLWQSWRAKLGGTP